MTLKTERDEATTQSFELERENQCLREAEDTVMARLSAQVVAATEAENAAEDLRLELQEQLEVETASRKAAEEERDRILPELADKSEEVEELQARIWTTLDAKRKEEEAREAADARIQELEAKLNAMQTINKELEKTRSNKELTALKKLLDAESKMAHLETKIKNMRKTAEAEAESAAAEYKLVRSSRPRDSRSSQLSVDAGTEAETQTEGEMVSRADFEQRERELLEREAELMKMVEEAQVVKPKSMEEVTITRITQITRIA